MVGNPRNMFGNDVDLTRMYDFSLLSYQQKADFIEMVFSRQRNIGRCMVNRSAKDEFLNMLETKRDEIISCLNGKLNFYSFSSYFCRFFED